MTSQIATRVLKLGGSLLSLSDWPSRLRRWLDAQMPARNIIVVGGGDLADAVREIDRQRSLDAVESHWMCIAAMAINAWRVAAILEVRVLGVRELLLPVAWPGLCVVDPWEFLRDEERKLVDARLPVGWHVTSDSIAARIADVLRADELLLLKSCLPTGNDVSTIAASNYVDAYFPYAAKAISHITCVDLRSESFDDRVIRSSDS